MKSWMPSTAAGYTCRGDIRGSCPHTHRTLAGAVRCNHRDQAGCRAQGGYSDRAIYEVDRYQGEKFVGRLVLADEYENEYEDEDEADGLGPDVDVDDRDADDRDA